MWPHIDKHSYLQVMLVEMVHFFKELLLVYEVIHFLHGFPHVHDLIVSHFKLAMLIFNLS